MEYMVIIQENLENGSIYLHNFDMEECAMEEAIKFRDCNYHSDCVFIISYSKN